MKTALSAVASLAAMFLAGSALGNGLGAADMSSVLTEAGYPVDIGESASEPAFYTDLDGLQFAVFGFNCAEGACAEYLFYASFETAEPTSLDIINEFNESLLVGRAYLDDEGESVLEYAVSLADAGDKAIAVRALGFWEEILPEFAELIGFATQGDPLAEE